MKSYVKHRYFINAVLILTLLQFMPTTVLGGNSQTGNDLSAKSTQLPPGATQVIVQLDFKNTDLRDVVRSIADKYRLNVFVENQVNQKISIHLVDISAYDALRFIASEYNLVLSRDGAVFYFKNPVTPEPLLNITYENEQLSVDLENEPLPKVLSELTHKTGFNVVTTPGVSGNVSGFLKALPFERGLSTLMTVNGFRVQKRDEIYYVERDGDVSAGKNGKHHMNASIKVNVKDSLISIDVTNSEINKVLQEIFSQVERDLVIYEEIKGKLTARFRAMTLNNALTYLLRGTPYSFKVENGAFLVGGQTMQGISQSKLIRLQHIKGEQLLEMLPENLLKEVSVKIIKEHNGFVVIGAQEQINEVQKYVREIDQPIAQVLIEALVIDFNRQKIGEFGIKASSGVVPDTNASVINSLFPSIDVGLSSSQINNTLSDIGLPRITILPDDFYLQVKALESEGKANVRSRPQIATLNGHTASISIGTTQYFILETNTPIQSTTDVVLQQSQRFETIKAEMLLKVTPWVTASGEIIAEINPEFSTPRDVLDSNTPPTIDHRILESTVKLKDGETIILGGLIQEIETESISRFPFLGHLPLLGRLFQHRSYNKTKAELIIYLTPHVYYVGDEMGLMQGQIR